MPTMKQVNEMIAALAEEFDFSEHEARVFLKLPLEVAKPASGKQCSGEKCSKPAAEKKKQAPAKSESASTPRGPTAYNLFVKAESQKVKAALEKAANGAKLERGAVMRELGTKWKALNDAQKAKYAAA